MESIILEKYYKTIHTSLRERGTQIMAKRALVLVSESYDSIEYKVNSDSNSYLFYKVSLKIRNEKLKTTCNCPYFEDFNICKHIAGAISFHLNGYKETIKIFEEVPAKYNPALIELPYEPVIQEFVEKNSNAHNRSFCKNFSEYLPKKHFVTKEKWKGHLVCEMGDYHFNTYRVTIDIEKDEVLKLTCTCKQTTARFCEHKHTALYIQSNFYENPDFLLLFPSKEELIAKSLEPYGFSPDDPDIDKFFNFNLDNNSNYVAKPRDSSLLKISGHGSFLKNLLDFNKSVEGCIESLPEEKTVSDLSYGYVLHGIEKTNTGVLVPILTTICGTIGKDSKFSKNIATKAETLEKGRSLPVMTINQELIESLLANLQTKNINKILKRSGEGEPAIAKTQQYITEILEKLFPAFQNEHLFFSVSFQYSISRHDLEPVKFSNTQTEIKLKVYRKEQFIYLKAQIFVDKKPLDEKTKGDHHYYFFVLNNKIYLTGSNEKANYFHLFIKNPSHKVHYSDEGNFLKEIVSPLSRLFEIEMKNLGKPIIKQAATNFQTSIYLSEQANFLMVRPIASYNEGQADLFSDEIIFQTENTDCYIEVERDKIAELEVKNLIISTHNDFNLQQERGFLFVHLDKLLENDWYYNFFEVLQIAQIPVYGLDKIKRAKYSPYKAKVKTKIGSGINWFDVEMEITFGKQQISLKDVQKAIIKKENFVRLDDGTIGLLPSDWVSKLTHVLRSADIDKEGKLKLSKFHFSLLEGLEEESDESIQLEIAEKKKRLLNFDKIHSHALPKEVNATLRPYQQSGFDWLMFLDSYGWGGCLADDMGLGKTLQMITFLKKQVELYPNVPNLVILPTTLLFNWQRELEKFSPTLTYLNYSGTQRNKDHAQFNKYHIVLTTYGLVANDASLFVNTTFNYIILDESQAIKNPESQRYKAVCMLKSRNRAVMTGTPIENNIFDLYAQMNFANPGLLGNLTHFKNFFSTPIDKNGDQDAANTLRKLIAPFLLRRTKEQVAKDLPQKTEDIIFCEMGTVQRKVYEAFRDNFKQMIGSNIDKDGIGKSSMMVLDALLKLRQICNSPALLNTIEDYGNESIKTEELIRHLTEKTGKHKVLVFSQFTSMLAIVEEELKKSNLLYEYLDGQTASSKREEKVKRFQSDPSVRVFLISLKAGGVGLNLTEADYVYLIDPWWNPAVEAQAIDRVHRIGQTKNVFAYRMICKDTIEEKVLLLQEKKRKVAKDIISTEASFYKQLDKADIMDLFS